MSKLNDAIIEYNAKKLIAKELIDEKFKAKYMYALWRKYMEKSSNSKLVM